MKIGILTRRYGYNHGSSLQALAMSYIVREMGYEPEIINYDESSVHPLWKIKPIIDHLFYPIRFLLPRNKRTYLKKRIKQERRFKQFELKYFPLSEEHITSRKQLSDIVKKYHKILIGSDQIWSPLLYDPNYFGAFTEDKEKLIPYAPSLGVADINLINDSMKELLRELQIVSCREKEGAEILMEITHKPVPVVLDPTLIVSRNNWVEIAKMHPVQQLPDNYILTYYLGKEVHQKIVDKMHEETGWPIINIAMFNRINSLNASQHITDLGPGEFLNLIQNANHVFTDSFHASIFAWIFERQFTIFERFKSNDKDNQNSRIYTLIRILGCEERLWGNIQNGSHLSFEAEKEKSWDYLKQSLV